MFATYENGLSANRRLKPEVLIRIASFDEADTISATLFRAFISYKHLYTPEGFRLTTPSAAEIRSRWEEGPVWVAVLNREIIGTVAAVPMEGTLHIRSMAVLPEARGQRTGQALLRAVEVYARTHGFGRLDLDTTPFLERAIRLYLGDGFSRVGPPHDLAGTPLFSMEKRL